MARVALLAFAATLAASATAQIINPSSLVATPYCVVLADNVTVVPWVFEVDPTTGYIYLDLPTRVSGAVASLF